MQQGLSRRALGGSAVAAVGTFGILRRARGEEALKIRCSLDTAPSHMRNVSIVDYLKKVEAATGGKITSEVFHSGQLYRRPERRQGAAAGAGGHGGAGRLDADRASCLTAISASCRSFYGQPIEATEQASDGKAGALVVKQIETKLRVKVIGPWLDLGFQNWYTTKKPLQHVG